MKTMICRELGGSCDHKLSAETWGEMVNNMTAHVPEKHPEMADEMKKDA